MTGSFPAKVTWFYRGIQTGSHRVLASYAEPILYSYLVIESAVAEDNAGVYRCLASVSGFDPLSANISLLSMRSAHNFRFLINSFLVLSSF